MTLDKDNIYSGIEGKLRTLNFSRILKSFEDKVDFSTPNTRSKSKKLVHSTIEKSLAGLIGNIGIDNNWLASVISPDVVESLGKLPTSSLKYLESDLIIAITNYCINTLDSDAHYSILPYQTSINRFLILYLFLSNNMADVRKRLSTPYYTDEFTNIVANNEMSKANKNIQSVAISDSDIKLKYKEFLKELGVVNDNPDIKLNRTIDDIVSLNIEQLSILKTVSSYVKVGGYLYYSTCSILDSENIAIVNAFMSDIKGFSLCKIDSKLQHENVFGTNAFLPDISGGLGFYVAKFKREF